MLRAATLALLIVSGCSVLKNTRAQDLAWERWKQCDHFPGVSLTKIETNGLVWVQYGSMRVNTATGMPVCITPFKTSGGTAR